MAARSARTPDPAPGPGTCPVQSGPGELGTEPAGSDGILSGMSAFFLSATSGKAAGASRLVSGGRARIWRGSVPYDVVSAVSRVQAGKLPRNRSVSRPNDQSGSIAGEGGRLELCSARDLAFHSSRRLGFDVSAGH